MCRLKFLLPTEYFFKNDNSLVINIINNYDNIQFQQSLLIISLGLKFINLFF